MAVPESAAVLTVDDLGFESPSFTAAQVAEIAQRFYGVSGRMQGLHGERDQNTRITAEDGHEYVLKISGAAENPQTVDFQVGALLHIEKNDPGLPVPRLIPGSEGDLVHVFEHQGDVHSVRMLSYLPGIPYRDGQFPSASGLENIGTFLARLDRALAGYDHPASRAFMPWDICNGLVISPQFRALIPDPARALCLPLLDRIEHEVYPQLPSLRKQVIHQDGHGGNLLRAGATDEEVAGVIDFGDMIHGPLISDVTIAASHFMETAEDPEGVAAAICRGYHSVTPLLKEETDVLPDLVIARQILTLQLFEFRRVNMPAAPALDVGEKPRIMRSLRRLAEIDRRSFCSRLASSCGPR